MANQRVFEQLSMGGIFILIVCIVGALFVFKGFRMPHSFGEKDRKRALLKRRVAEMARMEKSAAPEEKDQPPPPDRA
jgi:hypothetical protein